MAIQTKTRLLVVDDDNFVRDMLSSILESYDYIVETAGDGQAAYDKYVKDQQGFAAIVSDMDMPVMSGLEMTRQLRADGFDVPVLILTGNMDLNVAIEAMKSGAGDYILKTEDIQESIVLAVENALEKKRLREQNKSLEQMVAERTTELNASLAKVKVANRLIRQTFGRYLSEDVVEDILSSPEGAALGGESRLVTVMMTDLRGFTSISEKLTAKSVLAIINIYLEQMTGIIMKYKGTIIEFIGDAIMAVFGAPTLRDDDARRAVACAVEMQRAMTEVNSKCRDMGYPEVEQGIGLNTGECVVGNIGSDKRTKYGVAGRHVNLTARIESYTVGGQILVSESTIAACGADIKISDRLEVMPKGVNKPIAIYDVSGIGGQFNAYLEREASELMNLDMGCPVCFFKLEGKNIRKEAYDGRFARLSRKEAVVESDTLAERLSNLRFLLFAEDGSVITTDLYAKVVESPSGSPNMFRVNFTSVPAEAKGFLDAILARKGVGP